MSEPGRELGQEGYYDFDWDDCYIGESMSEAPKPSESPSYWAIVVDDSLPPPPELRQFYTFNDLVDFMRDVVINRKTAWVLPLYGFALRTTEGIGGSNLRFLVNVDGVQCPLFDMGAKPAVLEAGFYQPSDGGSVDPTAFIQEQTTERRRRPKAKRVEFDDSSDLDDFDHGKSF